MDAARLPADRAHLTGSRVGRPATRRTRPGPARRRRVAHRARPAAAAPAPARRSGGWDTRAPPGSAPARPPSQEGQGRYAQLGKHPPPGSSYGLSVAAGTRPPLPDSCADTRSCTEANKAAGNHAHLSSARLQPDARRARAWPGPPASHFKSQDRGASQAVNLHAPPGVVRRGRPPARPARPPPGS
jgi:hypothetical protein